MNIQTLKTDTVRRRTPDAGKENCIRLDWISYGKQVNILMGSTVVPNVKGFLLIRSPVTIRTLTMLLQRRLSSAQRHGSSDAGNYYSGQRKKSMRTNEKQIIVKTIG